MTIFKVKDVAEIINGYAFPAEQFNSDYKGLPIIRIRDILRGFSETYYSGEYSNEYIVNNGDLLIGMDGEFNIQTWQGGKALLNQRVCKIKVKEDISNHIFLKYCLALLLKKIEENTPFVTVKHLSSESLKNEEIFLPPLEEQKRIAEILSKCDNIRRIRKYSLQVSDTYLQSVFLEMFGDPSINPMGWELRSLLEVILTTKNGISRRRKTNDNIGTIVLRIKDIGWNVIDYSDSNRIDLSENELKSYSLENHDLLLVRVNGNPDLVGRTAIFKTITEPVAFNDHIIQVKLNKEIVNAVFLANLLNSPYCRSQLRENVITTAGQYTINRTGLSNILIPLPPLLLQEKFAKIIEKFERFRNQQREAQHQADHLFQTLLHQAFTGKL